MRHHHWAAYWAHDGGHCMGRHSRGFGHFTAGFMGGPGRGGASFSAGRKLASGDLQLLVLALLADKPRHGYEIIKALDERSGGFYSPSPGMVYPALTYLEEIGHATVEADGAKKLYHITDDGRAYLEEHRDAADAMLAQLDYLGRKMDHVRSVFSRDEAAGDDAEDFAADKDVWRARRELKSALHEHRHAAADQRKRIADVLRRAAQEIRGGKPKQ